MLDSDWFPPRPAGLWDFREVLVDRLTTPLSVALVAGAARYLTREPITDRQAASRHAEALLSQLRGDLRHATLYHVDQRLCAMVAVQSERAHRLVLREDMVPARHGLAVYAWPVAFIEGTEPRLDLAALSWAPTRDRSLPDGGVDVTLWAAPTRHVRRHLHAVAAEADTAVAQDLLTRHGWRQRLGPLVLVNQVAWGYGTSQRAPAQLHGFMRAAVGTFVAATNVEQVRVEPVRPSRLGFLRAGRPRADTEAYRLRLPRRSA